MEQLQNKLEFKEYTKGTRDKSSVWNFFLRTSDGVHAQCKKCKKVIKCRNTTTCLHNHMKLHPVESIRVTVDELAAPGTSGTHTNLQENEPKKKKVKLIDDFFKKSDSVENIVAKMTACDGLPFSLFCTSDSLRNLFKKSGYEDLPKSPNTIKKIVVEKSEQVKGELKETLQKLKAKGQKFSVSLDEWTSARNRRYMNVNIHCPNFAGKSFRNLGLARITGRGTAERCANILKDKLAYYNLSLEMDIACVVTDGASVMCAMGRQLPSYHQLCFAHGIQCAVLDVIYKKTQNAQEEEWEESTEDTGDRTG